MPDRIVVVNSTPIIALRDINRLGVLKELYGTVTIPNAVFNEVTVKNPRAIGPYPWIGIKPVMNEAAKEAFTTSLHDGEVETMLLAKEIGADLIIMDDGLARRHAKYLGLTVTGTAGVLLRAKESGIIKELRPVLDELIHTGFYISNNVCREILQLAGE